MSGGSFNYLYGKSVGDLMNDSTELERMVERIGELNLGSDVQAAANDLSTYVRNAKHKISAAQRSLEEVFRAVEWQDSFDTSFEDTLEVVKKWRNK